MNKFLLFTLAGMTAFSGAAVSQIKTVKSEPIAKEVSSLATKSKVVSTKRYGDRITVQEKQGATGLNYKNVIGFDKSSPALNPGFMMRKPIMKGDMPEGMVLYEDFEEWNGEDSQWLPEGWTRRHILPEGIEEAWAMYMPDGEMLFSKSLVFPYLIKGEVDSWIITPEVTITDDMEVKWECLSAGSYYYDWEYLDFTTFEFSEMVIVNDFLVNISTDGGETWTLLKSIAEEYSDITNYFELLYDCTGFKTFSVSLEDYVGKNVMIGFQVVGELEQSAVIDNVMIGRPQLELSYSKPEGSLWYGLTKYDVMLPASILTVPVFEPVTYYNTSENRNVTYSWTYDDTEGEGKTSDNQEELTIIYETNYSTPSTTRNNIYDMPVLSGVSPTSSDTEFSYSNWVQAGNKAQWEIYYTDVMEYETLDFGMTVADPRTEGTATYADIALPYFGYNQESDRFWTYYTFGDYGDENNWAHLTHYADFFYAGDAPLVINGVHTNAYGKISPYSIFFVDIYPIDENFEISDTPLASSICSGEDLIIFDRGGASDYISINFTFEEPVVISKDVTPYYIVAISGFNDPDNIDYFSPEMSDYSNPEGLALGWIGKELSFDGDLLPLSWSSVYSVVQDFVSFYIMLDATYPWLQAQDEVIMESGSAEVPLNSYYEGSELQIENLPSWLKADADGVYGDAKLSLTSTGSTGDEAEITLKGYGVSKTIKVKMEGEGGVENLKGDNNENVIYNLQGIRLNDENLPSGIYIINGKKTIIK